MGWNGGCSTLGVEGEYSWEGGGKEGGGRERCHEVWPGWWAHEEEPICYMEEGICEFERWMSLVEKHGDLRGASLRLEQCLRH